MRRIVGAFLAAGVLSLGITGCTTNSDEATSLAKVVCQSVTTPYETWITAGGDTLSSIGSVGRRQTMTALEAGIANLSGLVSSAELDAAEQALSVKEHSFTAADVSVGLSRFRNAITSWEELNEEPWTAGEMVTIDNSFYKNVQNPCGSLSGSDEANQDEVSLGSRDEVEANAQRYESLEQAIAAYEGAGGPCSPTTIETGEKWSVAHCSYRGQEFFGSVTFFKAFGDYEQSRPTELTGGNYDFVYGPNWLVFVPKDEGFDIRDIAEKMGGIPFEG